jgi:GNAT superfamily N-acetyltransferase
LQAPSRLSEQHRFEDFSSGEVVLDTWLKTQALPNQAAGVSRTYVAVEGGQVAGYYCLSSAAISLNEAPRAMRHGMPDPLPMILMGRLAVDQRYKGQGLGTALLKDAVLRAQSALEIIGVRGLLVHALHDQAKGFYLYHGFRETPGNPLTLVLPFKLL